MKQVTMESISQRIAVLESAGKIVGGLSLSSEFELACLRELVAVTEKVRAVTEQRDALVVGNATLREAAEFAIAPDMWEELGGNVLRYQYQEWYADKLKAALSSPAINSAIASLRAEGVEMFANKCSEKSKQAISSDTRDNWWLCGEHADDFARQLRESKGDNHA